MSNEHKMLLSDERIKTIAEHVSGTNANDGIRHERRQAAESALYLFRDHLNVYEADRAKMREVVQRLVDALDKCTIDRPDIHGTDFQAQALSLAKSELNIEPTKP